jgi:hypothetical protein
VIIFWGRFSSPSFDDGGTSDRRAKTRTVTVTTDIGRSAAGTAMAETAPPAPEPPGVPSWMVAIVWVARSVHSRGSLVPRLQIGRCMVADGSFPLQLRHDVAAPLVDEMEINLFLLQAMSHCQVLLKLLGGIWVPYMGIDPSPSLHFEGRRQLRSLPGYVVQGPRERSSVHCWVERSIADVSIALIRIGLQAWICGLIWVAQMVI